MKCVICDDKPKEAIVLQAGYLFDTGVIDSVDDIAFYPVCGEHTVKLEVGKREKDSTISLTSHSEGSPANDLHMVLNFIREYFRDKPLPGMDKITPYGIDWLENERLSALIRIVRGFQVAQLELDYFIENNGPD